MDNERKRILLSKSTEGYFNSQYVPLSAELNDRETPVETLRKLISEKTHLDFAFLGHNPSMPLVLDSRSVKIYPPFHVQVTHTDDQTDLVDYVYLAQAKASPDLPDSGPLIWVGPQHLKKLPTFVGHLVRYILALMN